MKKIFFCFFCCICFVLCKKPASEVMNEEAIKLNASLLDAPVRYKDSVFSYSQLDITNNIIFRDSATDYHPMDSIKKDLALDFYEPRRTIDPDSMRPLIIFMHGGGFEGGDKSEGDYVKNCKRFAARGYTVASINYRLRPGMCAVRESITLSQLVVTIYRAIQDTRYAVRYLKSRAHEADIDTNYIFFAGLSAGAVTALHLAYMDQDEIAQSPYIDFNTLGELDYGESFNNNSKVKAVIAFSGALNDINWIEAGDIPAICLHSDEDNMLPVDEGLDSIYHELYLYSGIRVSQRLSQLGIQSDFKRYEPGQTPPPFTCINYTHGGVVTQNGKSAFLSEDGLQFAVNTLYEFFANP
jgi:acetyl esterase/lipase